MVGIALGKLWDTHPKIAFVCHLFFTLLLGGGVVMFLLSGTVWWAILVCTVGFVVMAGLLVLFTWLAIQDNWSGTS